MYRSCYAFPMPLTGTEGLEDVHSGTLCQDQTRGDGGGLSRREAATRFGVHHNTITKMLAFPVPPGYRRSEPPASKKRGPYMAWIDTVLEADRRVVLLKGT